MQRTNHTAQSLALLNQRPTTLFVLPIIIAARVKLK